MGRPSSAPGRPCLWKDEIMRVISKKARGRVFLTQYCGRGGFEGAGMWVPMCEICMQSIL